jgi:hypothetical protein
MSEQQQTVKKYDITREEERIVSEGRRHAEQYLKDGKVRQPSITTSSKIGEKKEQSENQ